MTKKIFQTFMLSFLISFTSLILIPLPKTHAQIINKDFYREFIIQEDYIQVIETKSTSITSAGFAIPEGQEEVFTVFFPVEEDPLADTKRQLTLDSLKVLDDQNNEITFTSEESDSGNLIIRVPFTTPITIDTPKTITLSYNSYGLLVKSGSIYDVYIPGFPDEYLLENENSKEVISTVVKIPNSLPNLNFSIPNLEFDSTFQDGFNVAVIDFEKLKGDTVWIQLGTEQTYTFSFNQKIPATSGIPFFFNTYRMVLPRDIASGPISQKVYFSKITPEPFFVEEDSDGNLIVHFKFASNINSTIEIEGFSTLTQNNTFEITNSGSVFEIPNSFKEYLTPAEYWEVNDPGIQKIANELRGDKTDVYEIIDATYQYVIDQIDYSFVKKYGLNERKGAKATLEGGAAVCMEYSDLFITLMRAQGIPARAAFGFGYDSLDYETRNENRINHQWAEVYLPAQDTWVNIDTTWGDFGSNIIGGDLSHFYSHVSTVNPETPSLLQASFFGNSITLPDRSMNIRVVDSVSTRDTAMSQSELLQKYPKPSGTNNLQSLFSLHTENVNNQLNNALELNLGISNPNTLRIVKIALVGILLSPFVLYFIHKFYVFFTKPSHDNLHKKSTKTITPSYEAANNSANA